VYGSGAGSDSAQIVEYYASQSDRMRQLAGFALIVAAAVFLAVFAAGIASRVEGPESSVVAVAGAASAVLLLGATALWAASAFTSELESGYHIDPRTHLILEDAGLRSSSPRRRPQSLLSWRRRWDTCFPVGSPWRVSRSLSRWPRRTSTSHSSDSWPGS
jgi:hypothetical protein